MLISGVCYVWKAGEGVEIADIHIGECRNLEFAMRD